jgi:hypothetical protein
VIARSAIGDEEALRAVLGSPNDLVVSKLSNPASTR